MPHAKDDGDDVNRDVSIMTMMTSIMKIVTSEQKTLSHTRLLTYHIDIKESWQPFIVSDMLQLCNDNFTRLLVESFVIPFWIQHVQS